MDYTEFEIQAEAYVLLKKHFPLVRGEFFYEPVDRRLDAYGRIRAHRFDIVVFNDNSQILAVVEVKKKKGKHRIDHYRRSLLAPLLLLQGMDEVSSVVSKVIDAIESFRVCESSLGESNEFMRNMSAYV